MEFSDDNDENNLSRYYGIVVCNRELLMIKNFIIFRKRGFDV